MDWVSIVNKFFNYYEMPEDKKVRLVPYKLCRGASAWWDDLQNERRMVNQAPVVTWACTK